MVSSLNRRLKLLITLIIISLIACRLPPASCLEQSTNYIRVAIIQDTVSFNLGISGFYEITDLSGNKVLSSGRNLKTAVTSYKEGILLGGKNFDTDKLSVKTGYPAAIIINGRKFRGQIQLIKKENAHLLVVNRIDLENYVKGILYHESSHYWPIEALRAQAIACRTYALYQIQENSLKDYDATSDIYSQVYGGRTSERYRTNRAVDETGGLILTYQGKIFPAYYHATCAGHTEDASLLWNTNILPLKGVACNFCQDSPHFKWHNVLSQEEVKDKLIEAGYPIKDIKDIVIMGRNISGRITNLKIVTGKEGISIPAKDFRNLLGPNIIRSTNFNVRLVNHDIVFEGYGWGHGVGLCQWGAYFMAKQGYNYKQILEYYYPQAKVSKE